MKHRQSKAISVLEFAIFLTLLLVLDSWKHVKAFQQLHYRTLFEDPPKKVFVVPEENQIGLSASQRKEQIWRQHGGLVLVSMKDDSANGYDGSKEGKSKRVFERLKRIIRYPKEKIKNKLKKWKEGENTADEPSSRSSSWEGKSDFKINERGDLSENVEQSLEVKSLEADDVVAKQATAQASSMDVSFGTSSSPGTGADVSIEATSKASEEERFTNSNFKTAILSSPEKEEPGSGTRERAAATFKTDLSGKWELIVDEHFKKDYDQYLQDLEQPPLVRSVALSIVGMTFEEISQSQDGKELCIRGRNVRGKWERTLVASTKDKPVLVPIHTADKEQVEAECGWEEDGTVHRSWLRGVSKYGGGDFESKRYLINDGDILVCESTFHPCDKSRQKAFVKWQFRKHV